LGDRRYPSSTCSTTHDAIGRQTRPRRSPAPGVDFPGRDYIVNAAMTRSGTSVLLNCYWLRATLWTADTKVNLNSNAAVNL